MKRGILVLGMGLMTTFALAQKGADAEYIKKEMDKRAAKDKAYKSGHHSNKDAHNHSPLSNEQKANFKGLNYFDVDPKYNVKVEFLQFKNPDHISITLTSGMAHHYWVVGKIKFKLNGQDCELFVYQDKKFQQHHKEYKEYMFIPFRDETNGIETFAGGRYIEWHVPNGNYDYVDFNNAFNPACVYNSHIVCPVVPRENTVKIRIEAGEKDF